MLDRSVSADNNSHIFNWVFIKLFPSFNFFLSCFYSHSQNPSLLIIHTLCSHTRAHTHSSSSTNSHEWRVNKL